MATTISFFIRRGPPVPVENKVGSASVRNRSMKADLMNGLRLPSGHCRYHDGGIGIMIDGAGKGAAKPNLFLRTTPG